MTKSSQKYTPPPRRSSTRQPNQDFLEDKKNKLDEIQKSPPTKKNKTQTCKDKSSNFTTTLETTDDAMSVNTHIGSNKSGTFIDTEFTTFLYFWFKVAVSRKGSEMMRTKIQSIFKILQVADLDLCFYHYKLDVESDSEGSTDPILDIVVEDPEDIPESNTGMTKVFFLAHAWIKKGVTSGLISVFYIHNL